MTTNKNDGKPPRKFLVTSNKYQEEIILLAYMPSVFIFLTFILFVNIANPTFCNVIFHTSFLGMKHTINHFIGIIIFCICSIFFLFLIRVFIVTHHMVGAMDRIIRELDEIIAGRSQRMISSRPKDTLSKDLLKRVNVLVESYVKHENKNP